MGKTSKSAMKWARLAAKLSLLATDPAVRKLIGDRVTETVRDFTETVSTKYDDVSESTKAGVQDASDRMHAAAAAFENPPSPWPSRVGNMTLGIGVGVVLAFLFTPNSGPDARKSLLSMAGKGKNRVADFVAHSDDDQSSSDIPLKRAEG